MRLQDQLVALDVVEALSIWIVATNGLDGDVAHGLCRMLAKELPAWKIHLVICKAHGSGELGHMKGAREGCAVTWEAWQGPEHAKGGQDAWVAHQQWWACGMVWCARETQVGPGACW